MPEPLVLPFLPPEERPDHGPVYPGPGGGCGAAQALCPGYPKNVAPLLPAPPPPLKRLCTLAHESLTEYLRTALACPRGVPGIIMTLHTFGEYLDFHPHIHALVADGLFVRPTNDDGRSRGEQAQILDSQLSAFNFHALPDAPLKPLEELFRAKVINLLVEQKLLRPERVQVLYSWKHSGFNVHAGEQVAPVAKADLEDLAQYILRNPFSVESILTRCAKSGKMRLQSSTTTPSTK